MATFSILATDARADGVSTLRDFLAQTRSFDAEFTQTIHSPRARTPQESRGRLAIARPGRFHWQVIAPYEQTLVGDGRKVWLYDPELQQVTVRTVGDALGGTPAALLAGDGTQGVDQAFVLEDGGTRNDQEWALARPRDNEGGFSEVRFGFVGGRLATMELIDHFGQRTVIRFIGLRVNPKLAEERFRFRVPDGVDVLGE